MHGSWTRTFAAGQKVDFYKEPKPKVISYLIILFMFCEPQIILTVRRLVKINSICKCCNISVNKTIDAQVQALLSVICAARFHAHVSLAGKESVTLSVRSGGTNR